MNNKGNILVQRDNNPEVEKTQIHSTMWTSVQGAYSDVLALKSKHSRVREYSNMSLNFRFNYLLAY